MYSLKPSPALSRLFFLVALAAIAISANTSKSEKSIAESRYFNIFIENEIVGKLEVRKITTGNHVFYSSKTSLLKDFNSNIALDYMASFNGGIMQHSLLKASVNSNIKLNTRTSRVKNKYLVYKQGQKVNEINESITHGTIQLYFEEPNNVTQCYSEHFGSFNQVLSENNHKYTLKNRYGNENTYHFDDGMLKRASLRNGDEIIDLIAAQF
jgi:hypothetical protein